MNRRELLGVAAAACAACCVGPFLVAVGVVASLGIIGALVAGVGALIVAALVILAMLALRRRRPGELPTEEVAVEVGPTRR